MLAAARQRLNKDEDGFTLIELMVVVLIIGILLAIAIPNFLGAQKSAKDKAAESDIRNAMTAVRSIATDMGGTLSGVGVDDPDVAGSEPRIVTAEPSLTWNATAADAGQGVITYVYAAAAGTTPESLTVYTESKNSGKWFGATTDSNGKITFCKGAEADVATYAACGS